jgi:hypothetical protein
MMGGGSKTHAGGAGPTSNVILGAVSDDNTAISNTKIKANELQVKQTGRAYAVPNQTLTFQARIGSPLLGDILAASITPGTYDILRIRAGAITTIVNDAAWNVIDGEIFFTYAFPAASWQNDDVFHIMPNGDTTVVIGGNTYFAIVACWAGMIFDTTEVIEEIEEIEGHLHNRSFSFPDDITAPMTVTSHANPNTYGNWSLVANAATLLAAWGAAKTHFDANQFMIIAASNNRVWRVQIGYGDGTGPGTKVLGETTIATIAVQTRNSPVNLSPCIRQLIDGSSGLYMRSKDDTGNGVFDTFMEVHPYPHET